MTERDEKGRFLVGTTPGPGRDSKYEDWMNDQAYRLALLGLTDAEMAEAFGIAPSTYYVWQEEKPGFSEAINAGKIIADANVAHALYRRAVGVVVTSEKAFKGKDGNVIVAQTKTELPPDPGAAARWLAARQRKKWAGGEEKAPPLTPGTDLDELDRLTPDEIRARIAELQARDKEDL